MNTPTTPGRDMAIDILTRAEPDDTTVAAAMSGQRLVMHTAAPRGAIELIRIARSILGTAGDMLIQDEANASTEAAAEAAADLRMQCEDAVALLPDPYADDDQEEGT